MFCPNCETEYREGVASCVDCDVPLIAELARATLIPLAMSGDFDLVARVLERLEAEGVPYAIEAGTALSLWGPNPTSLDAPEDWEARIFVTADQSDLAREIYSDEQLRGRRESSRDREPTAAPAPPEPPASGARATNTARSG